MYGQSKAAGNTAVRACPRHYVIRTSGRSGRGRLPWPPWRGWPNRVDPSAVAAPARAPHRRGGPGGGGPAPCGLRRPIQHVPPRRLR
ncbi:hypothetical protein QJS66_07790 [Kocuria rhizophila]|nr:hypothetical protein QJS66_07790 [Kocuria rhizophila]